MKSEQLWLAVSSPCCHLRPLGLWAGEILLGDGCRERYGLSGSWSISVYGLQAMEIDYFLSGSV